MKVRKEGIIAIFIGLVIGLIITGGIIRSKKLTTVVPLPQESNSPTLTEQSDEKENAVELFIKIDSPLDNSIVDEKNVTISGTTNPNTYIAIIAEQGEHLIVPNDVGQFSQDLNLISGANTITITVYTNSGEKTETTLNIVYTTAEI